jgi:hypothetical protein
MTPNRFDPLHSTSTEGNQVDGLAWMLLRNFLWAHHAPTSGVGVIFGGRGHFIDGLFPSAPYHGIRVQNFLRRNGQKNIFFLSQKMPLGKTLRDVGGQNSPRK